MSPPVPEISLLNVSIVPLVGAIVDPPDKINGLGDDIVDVTAKVPALIDTAALATVSPKFTSLLMERGPPVEMFVPPL